ncbi:signal recognition particle-docking protein FtsY [Pseudomonas sp. MH10]|uniref:signal recognition particle-docking protein FtsY n=1 Tax=Pseudomonas sp. MH10 TaxID=3048627 RepID=UPI002AC8E4E2|nr:signal recognition particle-docking protein FtsY [Pseudomonas sp. MH10]MEB0039438.1 signal recognition particle-docking protein FtsY [Pseudomonas sp. MH10]WPX62379.1 signal recognition particle-docking protein FtsY [Pseudomonas sp. MH10]
MFGSNDDKKTPAPAAEKKGLFGWLRKKSQETAADQPQGDISATPEPVIDQAQVAVEPSLVPAPLLDAVIEAPAPENPTSKPWLVLPVAEEPVALIDELEPHVTPPIAQKIASIVQSLPEVMVEPVVTVEPVLAPEPVIVSEALVVAEPIIVAEASVLPSPVPVPALMVESAPTEASKIGFFARLKQGLSKTSASLGEGMASLFLGKKAIDDDLLEEIETRLLTADVGVEATSVIIQSLTQKVARKQLTDSDALYKSLQDELTALLKPVEQPLVITGQQKPFVILVVGVNGAGKTTTIGKLAKKLQLEGKKVMLAAGDTFRAAAVEQLQVWGERNNIPVIAQHTGADSASVIFDAVQAAKARGIDVLIADTAGRLHTKDNLMEELKKVRRVMGKLDTEAPHEVLLVLDAGTGQNAINQAKQFHQTVTLTGLALTKLDGTAKGGVIFALAKQFGLPIRYIGVGEGIDDLRTFEAEPFVQALFAERERT